MLEQFDEIEPGEEEEPEITLKYFVSIVRELKKVQNTRIYLLPVDQIITVFLDNIKEYVAEGVLQDFEETFFDLVTFANRHHVVILAEHQLASRTPCPIQTTTWHMNPRLGRPTARPNDQPTFP